MRIALIASVALLLSACTSTGSGHKLAENTNNCNAVKSSLEHHQNCQHVSARELESGQCSSAYSICR